MNASSLPSPGAAAVTTGAGMAIRPAATVMLVRDAVGPDPVPGATQVEVLMTRRHPAAAFNADAWVFPGGAVEAGDALAPVLAGPSDEEASALLGVAAGGLGYFVAAVRECFEESGILLARPSPGAGPGDHPGPGGDGQPAHLTRGRRELAAGRLTFSDFLVGEGLALDLSGVYYVSHWITPPGHSRRFDTRFFLAAAPPDQRPTPDAAETVAAGWTTPAEALRRRAAGEVHIVIPTFKHLEALAAHPSVDTLLAAAARRGPVAVVAPEVRGGGVNLTVTLGEPPCPT